MKAKMDRSVEMTAKINSDTEVYFTHSCVDEVRVTIIREDGDAVYLTAHDIDRLTEELRRYRSIKAENEAA